MKIKEKKHFDPKWLQFYMADRKVKVVDMLSLLGISRTTWQNKFSGRSSWYYEEVVAMKIYLELTDEEFKNVFPH